MRIEITQLPSVASVLPAPANRANVSVANASIGSGFPSQTAKVK